MSILQEIMAYKAIEVEKMRVSLPMDTLIRRMETQAPPLSMSEAFRGSAPQDLRSRILAEVKEASPSKGVLRPNLDGVALAREYEDAGAAAISVLTDNKYFQGSFERLESIRPSVGIPLLAKEFILDPWQISRARAAGADCILLIVACLSKELLGKLVASAHMLGMETLVEVHNREELDIALECGGDIIGVNNRDLKTFKTSINVSLELAPFIPEDVVSLSESGIHSREQMVPLENAGFNGFLIGEGLVIEPTPGKKLRELGGAPIQ